jgi:hypothetical protein
MKNPCERKGQGSSQRLRRFARESRFARFANMRTLGVATVAVGSLAVLPTLARANASAAVTLPVWDQIESIGYKFVSSYEGVSVGQDGVVNVYATSAGQPSIASALSAGGVTNAAYRLVPVAHSLADLQNLTQKLDTDQDSLRALGIDMIEWGPSVDPSVDTVSVEIADYTAAAAADLQNRYGGSWNGRVS